MNNKIILVFSDLEGTIMGESNGIYYEEKMEEFFGELANFQIVTGAEVKLHLVSPLYRKDMERILKQVDRSILKFNNKQHLNVKRDPNLLLSYVQGAAAYPEETIDNFFVSSFDNYSSDSRIVDLKTPIGAHSIALGSIGKEEYVRDWYESMKKDGKLLLSIYMGNGRNDLAAIKYLRSKQDALVISPANSNPDVKSNSFFSSDKEEIDGIIDGIVAIRKEIERRIAIRKQEDRANDFQNSLEDDEEMR